jgi:GH18 family chitinase
MSCGSSAGKVVGLYYADWAKYRASPYKYDASNIEPIVGSVTDIYYGFSFFCPPSD